MADPVDADFVLKTFLSKDDTVDVTRNLIGYGSLFAPVSIWRPRRKILVPHFNFKRLLEFVRVHSRLSRVMVEKLKPNVGTGAFSLWDYITTYTMDAIGEIVFGINLDAQKNSNHPFPKAFEEHSAFQGARVLQPWLQNDYLYQLWPCSSAYYRLSNFMKNFVSELVLEKKKIFTLRKNEDEVEGYLYAKDDRPKAMLESFIERAEFTDVEMKEEILVLVLAGTDTSAVGLAFAVSLLARHQDVQDKLYLELKEFYGDSSRPAMGEDLPHLKYLEAVIKETLRLYPSVPLIVRKIDQHVTLPSGRNLIPGIGVYINLWSIHRNPRYWGSDAEVYRPERFLEGQEIHPTAYMPFSRGPRNCIGFQYATMSIKTALINLVLSFKFLAPSDSESKSLKVKYDIMLKHVDNFRVKLEARN
ncbi:cytochrome P450 4C1-like [Ostrinia nubilalis]|uniref:cytochrome P450 4C1-like n=1 Tax=Ostrinia nubilalis TaxID=29057 RepID=UPI0030825B39